MAPGRTTLAACVLATLVVGCTPQAAVSVAKPVAVPFELAPVMNAEPPDTSSKAKEVDEGLVSKAEVPALATIPLAAELLPLGDVEESHFGHESVAIGREHTLD